MIVATCKALASSFGSIRWRGLVVDLLYRPDSRRWSSRACAWIGPGGWFLVLAHLGTWPLAFEKGPARIIQYVLYVVLEKWTVRTLRLHRASTSMSLPGSTKQNCKKKIQVHVSSTDEREPRRIFNYSSNSELLPGWSGAFPVARRHIRVSSDLRSTSLWPADDFSWFRGRSFPSYFILHLFTFTRSGKIGM